MTQSVYLYCNTFAKRDKVILPADFMEALVSELRNSAQTADDHTTVSAMLEKLNNGERIYFDEMKYTYIQKVKSLGVTALDFQKFIRNEATA